MRSSAYHRRVRGCAAAILTGPHGTIGAAREPPWVEAWWKAPRPTIRALSVEHFAEGLAVVRVRSGVVRAQDSPNPQARARALGPISVPEREGGRVRPAVHGWLPGEHRQRIREREDAHREIAIHDHGARVPPVLHPERDLSHRRVDGAEIRFPCGGRERP